ALWCYTVQEREQERRMITATYQALPTKLSEAAFEQFFCENFGRIYALLYRVTGSAEDAEDLAQELFFQASRQVPPVWEQPSAAGWLWKAATHLALNALRGSRRRRDRELRVLEAERPVRLLGEQENDPAERVERLERQEGVRAILRGLKPKESALLLLRHSGLSYADMAASLQINPNSVGTLLARAERRFKEKYETQPARDRVSSAEEESNV
ncbi:MAG: sigma-70 family RNA polymerase sigma factor, partial [Chloroflexota bacterium]|nr:sigma-70 family RNA polymerase sigma factor [Chloroflexota bacterium]